MNFTGKTAIVTGGSRGIGRAICLELARRGCDVAFSYSSSTQNAEELAGKLGQLGRKARAYATDSSDFGAVESMVRQVHEEFGRIDYLVNNAGIVRDKLLLAMTEKDWDEVLDINLKGTFNFCKAVIVRMIKERCGSILNITSISGIVGMPGQTNYAASKAGIIGFTKALAKEVASRNITVNALALGFVDTDMTKGLSERHKTEILGLIPIKRFGTVEEVAKIAAFLLCDDAQYITGQVIQADGGLAT